MTKQEIHVESYSLGYYLRAFADRLAHNGLGTHETKDLGGYLNGERFTFNHEKLNRLEVLTVEHETGWWNLTDCSVVLKGDPEQMKEFLRAAKSHFDELKNSAERMFVDERGSFLTAFREVGWLE